MTKLQEKYLESSRELILTHKGEERMRKSVENFAKALDELINDIKGEEVKASKKETKQVEFMTADAHEKVEETQQPFPATYKEFKKDEALFGNLSCTLWSKEKVEFVVPGASEIDPTLSANIKASLRSAFNYDGGVLIRAGVQAAPKSKTVKPKAIAKEVPVIKEAVVDKAEVIKACVELANRTGDRSIIVGILKKFGGEKVDLIPIDQYANVLAAVKNYAETTTAAGDEF
jgi:hypothetical protein